MSWLDELNVVLNRSTDEELEELWEKYNDYDCGPDLDTFLSISMDFFCGQEIDDILDSCKSDREVYTNSSDEFALAA